VGLNSDEGIRFLSIDLILMINYDDVVSNSAGKRIL
jgi:hypothetical protein